MLLREISRFHLFFLAACEGEDVFVDWCRGTSQQGRPYIFEVLLRQMSFFVENSRFEKREMFFFWNFDVLSITMCFFWKIWSFLKCFFDISWEISRFYWEKYLFGKFEVSSERIFKFHTKDSFFWPRLGKFEVLFKEMLFLFRKFRRFIERNVFSSRKFEVS